MAERARHPSPMPYGTRAYALLKKMRGNKFRFTIPNAPAVAGIAEAIRAGTLPEGAREYAADLLLFLAGQPEKTLFTPRKKGPGRGTHRRKTPRKLFENYRAVWDSYNLQTGRKSWKRAAEVGFPGGWDEFRKIKKRFVPVSENGTLIAIADADLDPVNCMLYIDPKNLPMPPAGTEIRAIRIE